MENNELKPQKKQTIGNFLAVPATQKFLEDNLKERRAEFVSNLLALCDNDKNLAECDPQKLMMCAMNATALNLPLNKNLGYACVIAYKGVPSFQIEYKGLIQLAIRTAAYEYINSCEVRHGEIERNKFTGEVKMLGEKPENKIIGYLASLKLKSGFKASVFMTNEQIEDHALRYSKMYQADKQYNSMKSKWSDQYERPKMAKKTVLKALLGTYGLITTEIARALENDSDSEYTTSTSRSNEYSNAEVLESNVPQQPDTSAPKEVDI